ncbi:unnamed protein product [Owenia fusiformis]|uniref:RWD domain-containing protein n=1 Tax=Owenia fusiformis TaxID=6347 RepID=A0A8S4NQ14_OWEFU|nr:unnamed protein product [Owenia fusiformis]
MAGADVSQAATSEIEALKSSYGPQCKVISNIGDIAYMVTIKPKETDLSIKFQLNGSYPSVVPQIIIKSAKMNRDEIEALIAAMTEEATKLQGKKMITSLVDYGKQWLYEKAIDVTVTAEPTKKSPKSQKKQKKPKVEVDDMGPKKKPPMKTATDVIHRIQWDEDLKKDNFIIGYMDRIIGLVEKVFTFFSWEDIASVDYNTLAIPKHRIQYFKYKSLKVWDKNKRLDDVFGSTGGKKTIIEVMRAYDEEHKVDDAAADSDGYDSDDSDDGINIHVGANIQPHGDYWQDKLRPNHFLALRITDEEIRKNILDVQDAILDVEDRYAECVIPAGALHVTLCVLGLDTPDQVGHAVDFLHHYHEEIKTMVAKDLSLTFKGVGTFFDRVLYAEPIPNQGLINIVEYLKTLCKENGIDVRDNHDFVPHLTIMKVTRPVSRELGTKEIDPQLYSGMHDIEFGEQKFDTIHLCSMAEQRQEDGFYISPISIDIA